MNARWSGSCCAACCVVEQEVQRGRAACALHAPVVRIMFLRFILSCFAAVNISPALQPARSGNGRGVGCAAARALPHCMSAAALVCFVCVRGDWLLALWLVEAAASFVWPPITALPLPNKTHISGFQISHEAHDDSADALMRLKRT